MEGLFVATPAILLILACPLMMIVPGVTVWLWARARGQKRTLSLGCMPGHDRSVEAAFAPAPEEPNEETAAVLFVDLASFTPLAEAMGDLAATEVLDRFARLVREAAARRQGRVVKQIGDAFLLVFSEASAALACAVEIEQRGAAEPQFTAVRSGLHWGPALRRNGDYLGTTVNIAARLAAEARRHQLLVAADVRRAAGSLPDVEFVSLGTRRLKGLARHVELFEARARVATNRERAIDPVCGMELARNEIAAKLWMDGERVFCSEECLRRFVVSPERYAWDRIVPSQAVAAAG